MSWWSRVTGKFSRKKLGHELGESDAPADTEHEAATRATGGEARAGDGDADRLSTTGTGPNETFVGRASGGDDLGYAGETGAEARAEAEKHD